MTKRDPEPPRCALCDKRCQNQADLIQHQRECEKGEKDGEGKDRT